MDNNANDSNDEQHIAGDLGEATDGEALQEIDEEVILCVQCRLGFLIPIGSVIVNVFVSWAGFLTNRKQLDLLI